VENLLLKYMEKGFTEREMPSEQAFSPFITLSREFGCPSKLIAQQLADALNRHPRHRNAPQWRFINKEVVIEAAKELELEPDKIKYLFDAENRGTLDDILASFSSNYRSSTRVKRITREVISSIARRGFVILVGRGGVAITRGYPHSLHIQLQAPLDWRVGEVSRRRGISEAEALRLAVETDRKRKALIELFLGKKFEPVLFDLIFNCKFLSSEEIIESIIHMMEKKKMI
jgi:cytidylate kinase